MIEHRSSTRIGHATLRVLVRAIFAAAGSSEVEASMVADHLVDANLVGHDSHGVIRVAKYVDWHSRGWVLANRHAEVVREAPGHAVIDGAFGYGQVIGLEAMQYAIERTAQTGVFAIAIRNSGHLGRIGAWPEQLAGAGFASVHFVNTSGFGLLVAPYGGSDRRLSANPIAAGAPRADGRAIVLDISTSAIAEGKIQLARNQGKALPEGSTLDARGRPNTDPAAFYGPPEGALLAFGGHKGYGLSLFCEILAGALTGGGSTHPQNPSAHRLVNNMLSVIFAPDAFCSRAAFEADLDRLHRWVTASPPREPGGEVLLPGDVERRTRIEREAAGVPLDPATCAQLADVARNLGVAVPSELAATVTI